MADKERKVVPGLHGDLRDKAARWAASQRKSACPVRIPTRDGRTLACDRPAGHTLAHYPKVGSGR